MDSCLWFFSGDVREIVLALVHFDAISDLLLRNVFLSAVAILSFSARQRWQRLERLL